MIARAIAICIAMMVLFAAPLSYARCDEAGQAWVRACAAEQRVDMSLESCPSGVAIVAVHPHDGPPLRVELSTKPSAFVRVNDVGLSPIGDFADWKREPASTRGAFDAVVACVRARPPTALLGGAGPVETRAPAESRGLPWLLMLAAAVALVPCARKRTLPRAIVAIVASAIACFAVRRLLVPVQFFHQNGQAPLWIEFALRGDSAGYGPGYGEIFRPFVAHAARPDLRLILVQELAAAFVPASAFAIARGVGARRGVALLIAVAVALDPLGMRLARSESYFATILTLLMWAGALLSTRAPVLVRAVSAGLLVASAARVHPLAWVPAALLPFLIVARPGRTNRVLREALIVTATIAVIVAVAALPAMRAVLRDDIGARFLPGALATLRRHAPFIAAALVVAMLPLLFRPTRGFARRALVLAVVFGAARASNIVRIDTAMISAAYLHLFAPVAIGAVAALCWLLPARVGVLGLALLLAVHVAMDRRTLIVPTDAREQSMWMSWRETLPRRATIVWLERAGTRVLALPLAGVDLDARPFHDTQSITVPSSGTRFYYRSSLCSTKEGIAVCARFEAAHRLRSIERHALPAIASQPWNAYGASELTVELFAIED